MKELRIKLVRFKKTMFRFLRETMEHLRTSLSSIRRTFITTVFRLSISMKYRRLKAPSTITDTM